MMEEATLDRTISLTHQVKKDFLSKEEITPFVTNIQQRLAQKNKEDPERLKKLNNYLENLTDFPLGRFLISNSGALSGYWTHYIIIAYKEASIENALEKKLLEECPALLATRERYETFQQLLLDAIKDKQNGSLCSIPSGMMMDLIALPINENEKNIQMIGIDWDETVFPLAKDLIKKNRKNADRFLFFKQDAWQINRKDEFDVLTTNGLNIYEKNDQKVVALYQQLFSSLKPGGLLIGSALAPTECWKKEKINPEGLKLQKELFGDILDATWQNYRSIETTEKQLVVAGFQNVKFIWDSQRIFYTFTAKKPVELKEENRHMINSK